MKRFMLFLIFTVLCLSTAAAAEQKDVTGCQDHPLFNRMPTYWIHNCSLKEFDAHEFVTSKGKKERIEGRTWKLSYYPQANAASKPSDLQILRNFENAVAKLGGKIVFQDKSRDTFRIARDGKEYWVDLTAEFTGKYGFTIVEKSGMAQDIVANAEVFSNGLKAEGHAAVYGILFDTGKSAIKPESAQAISEIAKLLKSEQGLKLYVVGHTDSVGTPESNLKLSQDRAAAVTGSLVKDHGISADRLKPFGNGPYAPVATNDTEEGRAKNRRVELVKQP